MDIYQYEWKGLDRRLLDKVWGKKAYHTEREEIQGTVLWEAWNSERNSSPAKQLPLLTILTQGLLGVLVAVSGQMSAGTDAQERLGLLLPSVL